MICAVISGPSIEEIRNQISIALKHCQLIELRFDYFESITIEEIKALRKEFLIPMIFTLRSVSQGGKDHQIQSVRFEKLLALAELNPEYIDLEYDTPLEFIKGIAEKYPKIKIILSYHNFDETPKNLDAILDKMKQQSAFLCKIAVRATQAIDCMRFLAWKKTINHSEVIGISMGEHGKISRYLSPLYNNAITYASVDHVAIAPGQISAKTLASQYHYGILNQNSQIFGLIGDPVETSISDFTHNQLLKDNSLDAVYVKMKVSHQDLPSFLSYAKNLFKGLSVTMPLKESILSFIDEIDPYAKEIGAVNTLLFNQGKIYGFNTDGQGALNVIERNMSVKEKKMVILGTGGSTKAIAFEACKRKAKVTILGRDINKAQEIANKFGCTSGNLNEIQKCAEDGYDILINTIPIDIPINSQFIIPHSLIMDIRTKPKETLFLKEALKKQCDIVYGYEMFIEQAIGQFNIWFKNELNYDKMRIILERTAIEILNSTCSLDYA